MLFLRRSIVAQSGSLRAPRGFHFLVNADLCFLSVILEAVQANFKSAECCNSNDSQRYRDSLASVAQIRFDVDSLFALLADPDFALLSFHGATVATLNRCWLHVRVAIIFVQVLCRGEGLHAYP